MSKIIGKGKKPTANNTRQEKSKKLSRNPDSKRASKVYQDLKSLDSEGLLGKLVRDKLREIVHEAPARPRERRSNPKKNPPSALAQVESKSRAAGSSGDVPTLLSGRLEKPIRLTRAPSEAVEKARLDGTLLKLLRSTIASSSNPPVSYAGNNRTGSHMRIERRSEYIGDISVDTTAFNANQLLINPGNSSLFKWLSQIAGNFKLYRFVRDGEHPGLLFEMRPINGTQNDGGVASVVQMNALDGAFTSKASMLNYDGCCSGPLWKGFAIALDTAEADRITPYRFVLPEGETIPDNADIRFYDVGSFNWATYGATEATPFEIWVHYNIEFATAAVNEYSALRTLSVEEVEGSGSFSQTFSLVGDAPVSQFQGALFTDVEGSQASNVAGLQHHTVLKCPASLTNDCRNSYFMVSFSQDGSSTAAIDEKTGTESPKLVRVDDDGKAHTEMAPGTNSDALGCAQSIHLGTIGIDDASTNSPGGYENYEFTGLKLWRTASTWLVNGLKFLNSPEGKVLRLAFQSGRAGSAAGWSRSSAQIVVSRVTSALYDSLVNPMLSAEQFEHIRARSPDVCQHAMFHKRNADRILLSSRTRCAFNESKMGKKLPDWRSGTQFARLRKKAILIVPSPSQEVIEDELTDVEFTVARAENKRTELRDDASRTSEQNLSVSSDPEQSVHFHSNRASPAQTPVVSGKKTKNAGWF